mmetsp:Transcript_29518/g.41156  ORF Transcript_29518/g.41156 Transcript_29518/m.41156 type:complete len:143 (+) Transcript_29518:141-569(+)
MTAKEAARTIATHLLPGATAAITRGAKTTLVATRSPMNMRRGLSEEKGTEEEAIAIKEHAIYVGEHAQLDDGSDLNNKLGPVVDTNGAGDAFVGGYLAAVVAGYPFDSTQAVESGHFAAGIAVRCRGAVWEEPRLLPSPKSL